MTTLTLMHGIPGSGKSTLAKKMVTESGGKLLRVNCDDIRSELGVGHKFSKANEKRVTQIQKSCITQRLNNGGDVIVDDTNLNVHTITKLVDLAKQCDAKIRQIYVDTPIDEAKRRNRVRAENGGTLVPDQVIDAMAKKSYYDGHLMRIVISDSWVGFVPRVTRGQKIIEEYNQQLALRNPIIGNKVVTVDVDGTLAHNAHAVNDLKYDKDYEKFFAAIRNADVNGGVKTLANLLRNEEECNIMVVTGRGDTAAKELISFLNRSGIQVSKVYAKKEKDHRKSYDYKHEVVQDIKSLGFEIVYAIDDDKRSIKVWEDLNIPVFRVAPHVAQHPSLAPRSYPEPRITAPKGWLE